MPGRPTRTARTARTVRVAIALLVVATSVLGSATATQAAGPARTVTPVRGAALPSEQVWLADVTAVTAEASAYLATRLPDPSVRPAIVLDIDNTALASRYGSGLPTPATEPVLAVAQQAKKAGAAVIFVTARPEILRLFTRPNLQAVGYPVDGLYMRRTFDFSDNQTLKTNARIRIEKDGYTIVANIGNNATDLGGGHAERTFKLPDYDGQLD